MTKDIIVSDDYLKEIKRAWEIDYTFAIPAGDNLVLNIDVPGFSWKLMDGDDDICGGIFINDIARMMDDIRYYCKTTCGNVHEYHFVDSHLVSAKDMMIGDRARKRLIKYASRVKTARELYAFSLALWDRRIIRKEPSRRETIYFKDYNHASTQSNGDILRFSRDSGATLFDMIRVEGVDPEFTFHVRLAPDLARVYYRHRSSPVPDEVADILKEVCVV